MILRCLCSCFDKKRLTGRIFHVLLNGIIYWFEPKPFRHSSALLFYYILWTRSTRNTTNFNLPELTIATRSAKSSKITTGHTNTLYWTGLERIIFIICCQLILLLLFGGPLNKNLPTRASSFRYPNAFWQAEQVDFGVTCQEDHHRKAVHSLLELLDGGVSQVMQWWTESFLAGCLFLSRSAWVINPQGA